MNCCDSCDNLGLATGPKGNDGSIIGNVARFLIPSSSILTLGSTPITLVGQPGIGRAIQLINWSIFNNYNSSPYSTSTDLQIFTDTATRAQGLDSFALLSTTKRNIIGSIINVNNSTQTQIIENKALKLSSGGVNPTGGNSDIVIYIGYIVITL